MKDILLSRAKAFAAAFAAGTLLAAIKALEAATGFDVPSEIEISILAIVSGWFVHDVPNKDVSSKTA